MSRSAFTLIEMLVVMALIAFVSSVVAPKGFGMIESINRFIDRKQSIFQLDRQRMIAFSREKSALVKNQLIQWDDNSTTPFPYKFEGNITSKGIITLP